jgi:hypothetical protein
MLNLGLRFKYLVEEGGLYDHRPISLLWKSKSKGPPAPMNISQVWLEEDDFKKLVASSWVKLSPSMTEPLMVQFKSNLKRTKNAIKLWLPSWKAKKHKEISEV